MITPRDINKLKAIGYDVHLLGDGWQTSLGGMPEVDHRTPDGNEAWALCKAHAQSPEGRMATMAAKVAWLREQGLRIEFSNDGTWARNVSCEPDFFSSYMDEDGADALFWLVPR